MGTFVLFLLALVVISGVLFLIASFAFGRGEEMAAAPPDSTPVELPDERPVTGADVRGLRLSVAARGYRMGEVDWVLEQLAVALEAQERELAEFRRTSEQAPVPDASPPRYDSTLGYDGTAGHPVEAGGSVRTAPGDA